jgi:hypothetical protein
LVIPVHISTEDTVVWHFDQKGVFYVKSAYHVLEDEAELLQVRQKGESSSLSNNRGGGDIYGRKFGNCTGSAQDQTICLESGFQTKYVLAQEGCGWIRDRCPVCFRFDEDGGHCF